MKIRLFAPSNQLVVVAPIGPDKTPDKQQRLTYFYLQYFPCNAVDGDKVETWNSFVVTKTTTEEGILWWSCNNSLEEDEEQSAIRAWRELKNLTRDKVSWLFQCQCV